MSPRDRILLLLVNGMSTEAAEDYLVRQGLTTHEAKETIALARQRIAVAAAYTRDEQIGRAVMRLEDLYAKSIAAKDTRTALQAQRELNRLMSLYADRSEREAPEADASALAQSLDLIAKYLLPLNLTEGTYPVEEHARIAADLLRQHGLATLRT